MTQRNSFARALVLGFVGLALAFALSLKIGAVDNADLDLIMQLRLPRLVLAAAVGAGLAVAGTVLQALFANPLCEPYTLGISSGSALGAVIGVTLGTDIIVAGLSPMAFSGSVIFAALLIAINSRPGVRGLTLLLSGVVLGLLGSSGVSIWMALSDPEGIQGAIFWLLGDLSRARLSGAFATLGWVLGLSFTLWGRSRTLDAFLLGDDGARALGVDTSRARRSMVLWVSLIVGACVSAAGMIGFLGLVTPHFARRFVGATHAKLLPTSALWGATMLVAADGLARWAARPYELPVGVVTALIGAPLFLWILLGRSGTQEQE